MHVFLTYRELPFVLVFLLIKRRNLLFKIESLENIWFFFLSVIGLFELGFKLLIGLIMRGNSTFLISN